MCLEKEELRVIKIKKDITCNHGVSITESAFGSWADVNPATFTLNTAIDSSESSNTTPVSSSLCAR